MNAREERIEVRTVKVRLYCTKCGCEMLPTGECLTSYPAQYPHKCTACDSVVSIFGKTYPFIDFEEV